MVDLGVGKNMVRAIRFWSQAAGFISAPKGGGHSVTKIGSDLLGDRGTDSFLEDIRTLWLIHWKLSTNIESPLLAWDYLLNRWQEPEIAPSAVMKALQNEAGKQDDKLSPVTLQQHFDVFIHTYVPTRGRKGEVQEDNLDSPLVELELIVKIGDRELDRAAGRREPIYVFRREEKPDITPELFAYCLADFWRQRHGSEETLPLKTVAHGHGSPRQIFKLPEEDIRSRVEALGHQTRGVLTFSETANLQQVRRNRTLNAIESLNDIYAEEAAYA